MITFAFTLDPSSNIQRKTFKFQKSIDKNASICFSTNLVSLQSFSQQDYTRSSHKSVIIPQRSIDFSKADNMGNETNISNDSDSEKVQEKEEIEKTKTEKNNKVYGTSSKKGINSIHDTSISMKLRGPTQ